MGTIVALICILVYLGVLVSMIIQINTSMENRRVAAEQEFYDLADMVSKVMVSDFDDDFSNAVQKYFNDECKIIEGVIITGPFKDFYFEKERGKTVSLVSDSPRFITRPGLYKPPFYRPLQIQGWRDVTVQAVAGNIDYAELTNILKQAMPFISIALALAFFTLLLESYFDKKKAMLIAGGKSGHSKNTPANGKASKGEADDNKAAGQAEKPQYAAGGSYSTRGRITREENAGIRLTEELQRCAAGGQDLAFISMEFKFSAGDDFYARFAADVARFFSSRDFVCEKGERGVSVICPGLSLDSAFLNADEFHNRIMGKYPDLFKTKTDLCMGISARTGRPVNAERLMFEAEEALERAMMDPVSHIVAFKSDPEKYREFMETRSRG